MDSFQKYVNEQFIGKDPSRVNVGRDIFKSLKENWMDKLGYIPQKPMALIKVTEQNSPIIKGLGFSDPDDLLLDNFGVMLSSCINTGSDVQRNVVDNTGIVRTIHFQENGNLPMAFATADSTPGPALSLGGFLQLGSGTTPPARPDFALEVPFVISPQAGNKGVITPVWIPADQEALVTALISNIIVGETIRECGMFCQWRIGFTNTKADFMISHDAVNTSFDGGDHIEITYTWSLS